MTNYYLNALLLCRFGNNFTLFCRRGDRFLEKDIVSFLYTHKRRLEVHGVLSADNSKVGNFRKALQLSVIRKDSII